MTDATGALDTPIRRSPSATQPRAAGGGAAALAAAALAACGGGGGGGSDAAPVAPVVGGNGLSINTSGFSQLAALSDAQASRFLLQAQLSASDADIAAVQAQGYARWIENQWSVPVSISGWDWLNAQGYGDVNNPANYYDSTTPGDYMAWSQLMAQPDAARKRMALALSEIMVVSLTGLSFSWRSHAAAHYWDTLNTHAFGNYRDLLGAITLNVAMGYYLNTKGNKKADGKGSQPDENYAREVMQLFTIGLVELNPDGTPRLSGGKPIDTYGASDVSNLAQVFTGYDLDMRQNAPTTLTQTGGGTRTVPSTDFARLPMLQVGNNHASVESNFLGIKVPANTSAADALTMALDGLFNHANTAPFVCKQLIQRLVTSNPSPAYVGRVAAVFANNGAGVRGSLAHVYAAILLDDEARGPAGLGDPQFGKLREPMLRLVQWGRSFGAASAAGTWKIGDLSNAGSQLGQSPLRSPTVFNFFRPGYVPPATALSAGAVAPEFQLVNESSVGGYLNFLQSVISNGINAGDIKATYASELALVGDTSALLARLNLLLCAGQLSAASQALILGALNAMPATTDAQKRNRVYAAVLMVMASADYLVQK
ncbi:MAG: DUF1800 domain-containing protein [Rhodoferax sp.]|nr:DUF1800 domain-containing protein [Rhodoferax sp.]